MLEFLDPGKFYRSCLDIDTCPSRCVGNPENLHAANLTYQQDSSILNINFLLTIYCDRYSFDLPYLRRDRAEYLNQIEQCRSEDHPSAQ